MTHQSSRQKKTSPSELQLSDGAKWLLCFILLLTAGASFVVLRFDITGSCASDYDGLCSIKGPARVKLICFCL